MLNSPFAETLTRARQALLDGRTAAGIWEGALSSSALATATAVFALHTFVEYATRLPPEEEESILDARAEKACRQAVSDGLTWLALHQNRDGGWGDTTISFSNISTTRCSAGRHSSRPTLACCDGIWQPSKEAAEKWIVKHMPGESTPARLIPAIIARYGKDKTFSVPILTMAALAGRLGDGPGAWRKIPQLPFELAAFPQRGFKWLRLPVVSYALPALIAIGLVHHVKCPDLEPAHPRDPHNRSASHR